MWHKPVVVRWNIGYIILVVFYFDRSHYGSLLGPDPWKVSHESAYDWYARGDLTSWLHWQSCSPNYCEERQHNSLKDNVLNNLKIFKITLGMVTRRVNGLMRDHSKSLAFSKTDCAVYQENIPSITLFCVGYLGILIDGKMSSGDQILCTAV